MKYNEESKRFIIETFEALESQWLTKGNIYKQIQKGVKERFGIIIESQEAVRKLVERISLMRISIEDVKDGIETFDSVAQCVSEDIDYVDLTKSDKDVLLRLSDYFPDSKLETKKNQQWETFASFNVKETDEFGVEVSKEINIPSKTLDRLLFSYSRYWENMSEREICDVFGITWKLWHAIKAKLNITKLSDTVSDPTLSWMSDENASNHIDKMTEIGLDAKYRHKFASARARAVESANVKMSKIVFDFEEFLSKISKALEKHTPLPYLPPLSMKPTSTEVFFFSDLHIWKTDTAWILRRLKVIEAMAINSKAEHIEFTLGWDLGECFVQDGMHPWQIEMGMDLEYGSWFELMLFVADTLQSIFYNVYKSGKSVSIHAVPGNHDRLWKKRDDDKRYTAGLTIYEFIKRGLSNTAIQFDYIRQEYFAYVVDWVNYILSHWENSKNVPVERLILRHCENPKLHTVLMTWHLHNATIKEWLQHTHVQAWALAWDSEFSESLSLFSLPSFTIIKRNEFDTVDVSIVRLPK